MSLLSCSTCLSRAVQNLGLEQTATAYTPLLFNTHSRTHRIKQHKPTRRHHATYDSLVKGHHRRTLRLALADKTSLKPNTRRKGAGSLTKSEIKDALARDNNRDRLLAQDKTDTSAMTSTERRLHYQLKKDVEQYYSDPLMLANAVVAKLRVPDFNGAIALVRASEGLVAKNVVSWNHCIDWCMSQGDVEKAWRLYNEIKKRGHRPDSHSYTIMLRGLSQNLRRTAMNGGSGSAERAVSIYNSMFAPNSAVVPNTIHTNAVLNVCARARDLESMWSIAGRLPEKGPGSPDRWTFTTILNAIREDATGKVAALLKDQKNAGEDKDGVSLEERQKVIFDEALRDGRKLWGDISFRWRRADLVLDEHLIVAMGRLILGCGVRKDLVEVFDLIDSTMNIKLVERGHKKGTADVKVESTNQIRSTEDAAGTALNVVGQKSLPLGEKQVYATPSNHTLSLIIETAVSAKEMKIGKAYWHYLTTPNGPFNISPDATNVISYLRLLRISRSSTDIVDLLSRKWSDAVAKDLYRRGTFVIAMSTCVRDKNNLHVFDNADKLLNLMQERLEEARVGMYEKIEAVETDPNLSYKERQAIAKARMADVDDITFGEDEALSEMQRTKSGVESLMVDPKALRMYVDLAVLKTPGWNEGLEGKSDAEQIFERDAKKNIMLRALRRLGPELINVNRLVKLKLMEAEVASRPHAANRQQDYSRTAERRVSDRAGTRVAERLEDMVDLLRSLVGAYDKVISINERFEDQGRPQLNKNLMDNYRDSKRRISGFLSRTKDEVAKITRGSLKYVEWRAQPRDEEDEDIEDDDEQIPHKARSVQRNRPETPQIARDIRKIYNDTDRSLGRLDVRSRRQRQERQTGVQKRMLKRMGIGEDPGVLDDDLNIKQRVDVEKRMRDRAFNINIDTRRQTESVSATI